MSFNDCKISEAEIQTTGVQAQADTLTGSAADNKLVFDALPTLVIQKLNSLIDQMQQQAAAGQIGVTPFAGMTAQTLQDALEQIQADIGGNYSGADGAGKVGYTPSEGVDASNVQAAIEAVQANLTAYIAKIKAATGAAEVGHDPITGMESTNVQEALEELRNDISDIVAGSIPAQSITSDMIQDGAVTADKLGSDVTGDTIPTSATDETTISSQLSNAVRVNPGYGNTLFGNDLNDWKRLGTYNSIGGVTVNAPPGTDGWGVVPVFSGSGDNSVSVLQMFIPLNLVGGKRSIYRRVFRSTWTDWEPLATATPPQEFDLPLASGWSNYGVAVSRYSKDQFGQVSAIIDITNAGAIASGSTVATLPAGFRPANPFDAPAIISNDPKGVGKCYFRPNGEIAIAGIGTASWDRVDYFTAQASFVASS